MDKPCACELCGSTKDYLNFHHLIPRTLHTNSKFQKMYTKEYMQTNGVYICKYICHKQIHNFITEKEMGNSYNTKELLLQHPKVKAFVEWRSQRVK